MNRTHILVDFENVQPSAADIRLVQGASLQLWIFRGPAQKKYSADVAEAWQPLGDRVHFVACAKAGRNAVDMHIALAIGKLIGEAGDATAKKSMRFTVVSKDTDFDPLLLHVRSVGYTANRVATLKAALGAIEKVDKVEEAAKPKPAAKKAAAKRPAKKAAAKKAAPPPTPAPVDDAKQKVIESLRRMGEKRPAKRKGLERHIESHLGRKLAPNAVEEIVADLERDGVLSFTDKKVEYSLPKAKK